MYFNIKESYNIKGSCGESSFFFPMMAFSVGFDVPYRLLND